jgi:hypothetical protein
MLLVYNLFNLLSLRNENELIQQKIGGAAAVNSQIALLKTRLEENPVSIEENLYPIKAEIFNTIGKLQAIYPITVKNIEQVEKRKVGKYQIVTYLILLEGNYEPLLRAAEYMELAISHAKLSALTFETVKAKGQGGNQINLNLKLYVQGVLKE